MSNEKEETTESRKVNFDYDKIENSNYFPGKIVLNPFKGVDPSRTFTIQPGIFVPNDPPGAYYVSNMAHYEGMVLSVHFFTDKWSRVEGSAVMVAPGIAFTAAHVVEEHLRAVVGDKKKMMCVGYTSSGSRIWRVAQIEQINGTDLMILSLELNSALPADNEFRQADITTRLPGIGETLMIAGFRASNEYVASDEEMNFPRENGRILWGVDLLCSVGLVTAFHRERIGLIPTPTLEVGCSTPGGVSGGPAFDKNGKVVGILSTSTDNIDGTSHSLVSLLIPGLALPIRRTFLAQGATERIRLIESDICSIDRRDAVRWAIQDDGQTRIDYDDYT
jgi:trypsin-like peptidase